MKFDGVFQLFGDYYWYQQYGDDVQWQQLIVQGEWWYGLDVFDDVGFVGMKDVGLGLDVFYWKYQVEFGKVWVGFWYDVVVFECEFDFYFVVGLFMLLDVGVVCVKLGGQCVQDVCDQLVGVWFYCECFQGVFECVDLFLCELFGCQQCLFSVFVFFDVDIGVVLFEYLVGGVEQWCVVEKELVVFVVEVVYVCFEFVGSVLYYCFVLLYFQFWQIVWVDGVGLVLVEGVVYCYFGVFILLFVEEFYWFIGVVELGQFGDGVDCGVKVFFLVLEIV